MEEPLTVAIMHSHCQERIVALEAESERLRWLLDERAKVAHEYGVKLIDDPQGGSAHTTSFEECGTLACRSCRAALKEKS